MKTLPIITMFVLVACGGSRRTDAHRSNDHREDLANPYPAQGSAEPFVPAEEATAAASSAAPAPAEEPNLAGVSCADRNPKKCLDEADAAFSGGNKRKAVALLTRACDLDEPDGCFVLAQAFRSGAVGKDPKESSKFFVRWGAMLEAGCDKDDAEHITRCGRMADYYAKGSEPENVNGIWIRVVRKDQTKADALFKKLVPKRTALCDQGDAEACFGLGKQYEQGLGVAVDAGEAKKLFVSSCKQKHPTGCTAAGMLEDACGFGEIDACDKLCEGGNDKMCEKASPSVKAKADRRIAKAKLPGLFAKCAANKAEVEKWRIAGAQAAKANNKAAAQKAMDKMKEIEPGWLATLAEIRQAIDAATDDGNERVKLLRDVHDKCSCDRDPDNPGPCK